MKTLLRIDRCLLGLWAWWWLCLFLPASALAQATLKPCRVPGLKNEVQCGSLRRALDPMRSTGPQIEIHYVVIPALARGKLPDPVFLLAGGPGQSAIALSPMMFPQLTRLNNRRDLVFVDQRGTGRSAPLECPEDRHNAIAQQLDPQRRDARLRECLAGLQQLPYGDLRYFTSTLAMQDLDAVRRALGVAQINLVGGSYGTRAALEYLRQFPKAVRRMVLDGVAPADMALPASASRDNQSVLDAMFLGCAQDAVCANAFPTLRADFSAQLERLPQSVTLRDPLTGAAEQVTLTRDMLLSAVRGPLYAPALGAALPYALAEAAQGRFDALMGLGAMLATGGAGRIAAGMHFSVLCAEDIPRLTVSQERPGRDFGTEFRRSYESVCAFWPRGHVPAGFYDVPKSESPVLLLSGGLDPVTPPRHGERVARSLGVKARHVVVANAGHGVLTLPCMHDVVLRFIAAEDDEAAFAVDTRCAGHIPRPPVFMPIQRGPSSQP